MLGSSELWELNSTQVYGTHVPVEEPSTASQADIASIRSPRRRWRAAKEALCCRVLPALGAGPSSWLAGLWWTNPIWPHHLVIFMFDNVAVPDELAWRAKSHSDSNDFSGVGNDSVLPAIFFRSRTSFLAD
jgi:hypothetical protein